MLQRLDAVEHQQNAALRHRLGDRLALGGGAGGFDCDAELVERPVQKSSAEVARSFVPWL